VRVTINDIVNIESVAMYNLLGRRAIAQGAGFQKEIVMDVLFISSG